VISEIGMRQSERAGGMFGKELGGLRYSFRKWIGFAPSARVFFLQTCPCTVVVGGVTERPSYSWNWPDDKVAACVLVDVADLIETKG